MVDQTEAEPRRDAPLQLFQLLVDELDDVAGFDVDQMVVMRCFVARAAVTKLMPFEDPASSNSRTVR